MSIINAKIKDKFIQFKGGTKYILVIDAGEFVYRKEVSRTTYSKKNIGDKFITYAK